MKVDRSNPNPGTWFPYDAEKPEDSFSLRLRVPVGKARDLIEEKATTEVEGESVLDDQLLADLMLDYSVVDWEKLNDENGKLELTLENKKLCCEEIPVVRAHYMRSLNSLYEQLSLRKERAEKN